MMTRLGLAVLAAACLAVPAIADDERGTEIRLGVTAHDLADHVEDGPNITVDALFASPLIPREG